MIDQEDSSPVNWGTLMVAEAGEDRLPREVLEDAAHHVVQAL